jgi:1-aminocyclopropane-1-carboxylate deaminase/D-cysteine desulfhydrase-like pyridoxal-dependent ACC family enzyme
MKVMDVMNLQIEINEIYDDTWNKNNISIFLLRLDKIHPVISGNKIFKLYYFLKKAISLNKKILTFGGAYSNHLAATAAACKEFKIDCIGIVRGDKPAQLSHTLLFCQQQGMQLQFVSRDEYAKGEVSNFLQSHQQNAEDYIIIPEGGYSHEGVEGAAIICKYLKDKNFTHVCCSVGTAATLAGLVSGTNANVEVIGFSALKDLTDFEKRMQFLLQNKINSIYTLISDYHFGGYAKKNNHLISFMNRFYQKHSIPLDFVYTAKMMFGVDDLLGKEYFPSHSNVVCIHTGGLQGNASLPAGILTF